MFPREVLNKIKWTGNHDLRGVTIHYLHRGAPGDIRIIEGREIVALEHSHFVLHSRGKETRIPYHRIKRIEKDKELLYDRSLFGVRGEEKGDAEGQDD